MTSIPLGGYERISEDTEGTGLGVERQRKDNETQAGLRGGHIVKHYTDNDLSAYKRKVVRPEFEQMLKDLRSGVIRGIIAYDLDRLARQPRDLERIIDIYDENPDLIFATVSGEINLATSDGRTMARVMVAFANKSSADTARRVRRKHLEIAETGRPVGGWRPFGWQEDRATLHPEESEAVREAVEVLIAGGTTAGVVRAWNEMGLTTTAGKPWSHSTLRQYLRNPRLVGHRTYQRKVLLNKDGQPVTGQWEPMLDLDTWERLVQRIDGKPDIRGRIPRKGQRNYLLSGLVRCGKCNGYMYGNARKGTADYYYTCHSEIDGHTMTASGRALDAAMRAVMLRYLESEEIEKAPSAWERDGELVEAEGKKSELMQAYLEGRLSSETVFPQVQALEVKIAEMKKHRAQWLADTTGPVLVRESAKEWDARPLEQRRAMIEKVIEAIIVKPATRRGNTFDFSRCSLVPRSGQVLPALPQMEGA